MNLRKTNVAEIEGVRCFHGLFKTKNERVPRAYGNCRQDIEVRLEIGGRDQRVFGPRSLGKNCEIFNLPVAIFEGWLGRPIKWKGRKKGAENGRKKG